MELPADLVKRRRGPFGDFKVFNAAVRSILTQRSQVVAVEKVVQQVSLLGGVW